MVVGIVLLTVDDPQVRLIGLATVILFGGCLGLFIWMIVVKRRQAAASMDPSPAEAGSRGSAVVSRRARDGVYGGRNKSS